ncbi:MAG: aldehyde dehydrogenase family protein [Rhodospirillaceae bacterium]|nr:aldehyde dehydrogenase family protein [Rhodospirillaceae bacterium]
MAPGPSPNQIGAISLDAAGVPALRLPALTSLVAGRPVAGDSDFVVLEKFTGRPIARVAEPSRAQIASAMATAHDAFERGAPPPFERAVILRRVAEFIDRGRDRFEELFVAETGFTRPDARMEIDRSIVTLQLSAEEATRTVGEMVPFGASPGQQDRIGFTLRLPIGIVCAITPFNSPLNTVLHKIAPALAAGNAVVVKPSDLTPLTAALLCETFLEAGLPPDLLTLLQGSGETVGRHLLEAPAIAFYSFTGSTRVGRMVQQAAGLRRTQLELGSIASTIICADADLDRAAPKIAGAAFRKAGQVCTSVQRVYVQRSVLGEVTDRLVEEIRRLPVGNPWKPDTRIGPMITEAAAQRTSSWIAEALEGQARILIGGGRSGSVMEPTLLMDTRAGMRVVDEEIFAPVLSILPFDRLEDAVHGANDTPYGLSAGIFTRDITAAIGASKSLRFGAVHINEASSARGDAMPFGGVKDSGFGREGPRYMIREVTEERLITINP